MEGQPAGSEEWAGRFAQQAAACDELGSPLWGRLLRIVGADVGAEGSSWEVVRERAGLRFGEAGPLRLVGASHRLALSGVAPGWAALLPSCGGTAPPAGGAGDEALRAAWEDLVARHRDALVEGLDRQVQTNEVGRAAALAYAQAVALGRPVGSFPTQTARLVEIGCSGGLNLRLDRFRIDLTDAQGAGVVLGGGSGAVRLAPEVRGPLEPDLSAAGTVAIVDRVGIDPHPVDVTSEDGRLTLLSFVWPDQTERFDRLTAAIDLARSVPATLLPTGGHTTAEVLAAVLEDVPSGSGVATVVQHSIVWQYIPTDERSAITAGIEAAGRRCTADGPLVWVRFEPDGWDRSRAAVHVRRWPGGGDRLVAHADYHGRWLEPVGP